MRDLNPASGRQEHPRAGRNPPTGVKKAAKKTAAKKAAPTGKEPPLSAGAATRRAAAIAAMPAGSIPVVVMAIDFFTGKPVKVIIQGRNPPTGDP